jgi:hypothetical protein
VTPEPGDVSPRPVGGGAVRHDDEAATDDAAPVVGALRPGWVAFLAALVVGAAVRAWQIGGRDPLTWGDSADFLAISGHGWTSTELWAGLRAPGVPLALKVLSGDGERYVDLQAAVAVLCWAALCASVATVVAGRWPRLVACAAVVALSLTTPVTMWERSILSESPGVAALALVVAAGLQVARGVTWPRVGLLVAASVPWLAVRDTHAVVALVGGGAALAVAAVLVILARRRTPDPTDGPSAPDDPERPPAAASRATPVGPLVALGALSLLLGLLVLFGAAHGERQAFPIRNVYEVRVLPYPDRVRWFADHGMPQADAFLGPDARAAYTEPGLPPVVYVPDDDPELGEWLEWVEGDGRAALARYAVTHPGYLLGEPWHVPERAFNNARGDRGFYEPLDHPHVPVVDALLVHPTPVVLVAVGLACGWAIGRWRSTPALATGAVTAILAVPHGVVAWHSDGMETARHLVVPALQFHLGVLLLLVGLLPPAVDPSATEPHDPAPDDG